MKRTKPAPNHPWRRTMPIGIYDPNKDNPLYCAQIGTYDAFNSYSQHRPNHTPRPSKYTPRQGR